MGAWGPKLYQDDMAEEIRAYYKDQLHRGKNGEKITDELVELYKECLSDFDDAPIFWFALADTQWDFGRLENRVKEEALYYINDGRDLIRWENENPEHAKKRAEVLCGLEQKLLSKQPDEKKISQYKLYQCEWNIGDVYAYQLLGDYAKEKGLINKYLYFVKVGEKIWHPGHIIPIVYFYWIITDELLGIEELKKFEYIPQFFTPTAYKKYPNMLPHYLLSFLSTSSKVIPKKQLTFVGNISGVKRMKNEDCDSYEIKWKKFEKYIIDNFQIWNEFSPHY